LGAKQKTLKAMSQDKIGLTRREVEVLRQLCLDKTLSEIAETLNISPETVRKHNQNLREKLKANTERGLVLRAIELGIFCPGADEGYRFPPYAV
jgi:DNA-binding CsgD family transcriptional regulator